MCRFSAEPRRKRKKSSSDNFAWPLVSAHQSRLLDSLLAPSLLVAPIEPYLRPYLERNTHSNVAPCTGTKFINCTVYKMRVATFCLFASLHRCQTLECNHMFNSVLCIYKRTKPGLFITLVVVNIFFSFSFRCAICTDSFDALENESA